MGKAKSIIIEILRHLERCLRPSYETGRPLLLSLWEKLWRKTFTLFQPNQDTSTMDVSYFWRRRISVFSRSVLHFICVAAIYLASELVIWGLSRTLASVHLEFFASILGMVLTFTSMTVLYILFRSSDDFYRKNIKSKVTTRFQSPSN